jgi:hypothetical protein
MAELQNLDGLAKMAAAAILFPESTSGSKICKLGMPFVTCVSNFIEIG